MDNKTPLKEADLSAYLNEEMISGTSSQKESDLTSFAQTALDLSSRRIRSYKTQTDMSMAYEDAQKYTPEQIIDIIYGTDTQSKADLSKYFFDISSIYRTLLLYYSTILTYDILVVPNYENITTKSAPKRTKMYRAALEFFDVIDVKVLMMDVMFRVLRDGVYYGLMRTSEEGVAMQPIPRSWCQVGTKDMYGNYNFKLDLAKFTRIFDPVLRAEVLAGFPKNVSKAYDKFIRSGQDSTLRWMPITSDQGLCLFATESLTPMFITAVEDIVAFKETKTIENERALEELSKIISHKIPLDKESVPIFEINEAKALHTGLVNMFADNKYIDIITSFGDIDVKNIQSSGVVQNQHLNNMASAIYNSAGISKEIFSAEKNTGLKYSVTKDTAIAYSMAVKAESWFIHQVNTMVQVAFNQKKYARFFEVCMLFLSHYNREDYIKIFKDLASSGYSKMLPYIAAGVKQSTLENLVTLEEDMNLVERMVPLQSSYTQSGGEENEGGAPEVEDDKAADQTISNKNSE